MPPYGLPERRHASILARMESLDKELEFWFDRTTDDRFGLGRHHTQVRRLRTTLGSMLDPLETIVKNTSQSSTAVLDRAEDWEKQILAAHSIWEIFRSKLVVREITLFRAPLAACDDLAWACYEPALQAFAPELKGPPLVFLSSTWSPFAQSRDANFLADVRASPGTTSALIDDTFQQVLNKLPIPLVGLPWYQTFHMPGAILVAHEVGHIVEADFKLTASLAAAIDRAAPRHLNVWQGWASEMFADMYGCVTMGPYFVGSLIDFLSTAVATIHGDTRRGGKYPTRALRIELALHALDHLGYSDAVTRLRQSWEDVYGRIDAVAGYADTLKDYVEDARAVAQAVCDGPYITANGQMALRAIPGIMPDTGASIDVIAKYAAGGSRRQLANYSDARQLFAAAQALHEQPQTGPGPAFDLLIEQVTSKAAQPVRGTVRGTVRRGSVRDGRGPGGNQPEQDRARIAAEEQSDRQLGAELFALLRACQEITE